jgi:hypothetical protein
MTKKLAVKRKTKNNDGRDKTYTDVSMQKRGGLNATTNLV